MDTKHSKSPWTRTPGERFKHDQSAGIKGSDGLYLAAALDFNRTDRDEEVEANARLIAAAPELLEALQELFEQCSMVHKYWGDGSNQKESDSAITAALAAIAKATS